MIIVLEGPDGVGKSTLIEYLEKNIFNDTIKFKFSDKSNIMFEDYKTVLDSKNNLLIDRFNLSEDVYSTIYNRMPKNSLLDHLKTFSLINEKNVLYFILYSSDLNLLVSRCHKRGDTKKVYDNLEKLNNYYYLIGKELEKLYPDNIILIDIFESNFYEKIESIIKRRLINE